MQNLEVEQAQGGILDNFIHNVLGEKLHPEFELQGCLLLYLGFRRSRLIF